MTLIERVKKTLNKNMAVSATIPASSTTYTTGTSSIPASSTTYTTGTSSVSYPSGVYWDGPLAYVACSLCDNVHNTGVAGTQAHSRDEAVVSAHANGWYTGRVSICPDCRQLVATTEEINKDD